MGSYRIKLHIRDYRQAQGCRSSSSRSLPKIPWEYYGLGVWKIDKISLDTSNVSLQRMVSHLGDNRSRRNFDVCLDRIDPVLIVECLQDQAITHFARAPVVLYLLLGHSSIENFQQLRRITVATGGASPTSRLIESMEKLGFDFIHLYGLTESFGPNSLRLLSALRKN